MTYHYVDSNGNYLGGFAEKPSEVFGVVVPCAPSDARQKWGGEKWLPLENSQVYVERRASEYPAIGDQMDALLKYLDTLPDIPAELRGIIDEWKAVKARNPKQ